VCILFFKKNPIPLTTTIVHTNKTIDETSIINNNVDSKLLDTIDQIEKDAIDITNV
jgi:hypothetical protein